MAKSIIQEDDWCYLCFKESHHTHHILGASNRPISDKYGLTIRVCWKCHAEIHAFPNSRNDKALKQLAQRRFQEEYPDLNFRELFGRNYL